MSDWFESVGQPASPERGDAPGEPRTPDNDDRESKKYGTATAVGALAVVVIIASAVGYLTLSGNDNDSATSAAAEVSPPTTSSTVQDRIVPEVPEEAIGVAGDCRPQDGEVEIGTDDESVRGAVARWQQAYYEQDVETLESAIAPGSWLHENDWSEVLAEAAPEGTTWCAVMSATEDSSVDVDVMVTMPDGDSTTYPQTVTGQQQPDGEWAIYDIETREE